MKSMLRHLFVVCVALTLVCGINAADKKKKKKKPSKRNPVAAMFRFPKKIELDEAQKAKVEALKKEYQEKVTAAMKAVNEVITPEQKKAAATARKEARAAGKKGKELRQAVAAALNLTAEQKQKMGDARKELRTLRKEINEKKMAILTAEQKEQLKKKPKKKKDS